MTDTAVLAQYDFEDGAGGGDPQGWTSIDRTRQEKQFHIDGFAEVDGLITPLEGSQSLWCGRETFDGCVSCPGYGNGWLQYFESVAFPSTGDVTVDFLVHYDSEPGYDYTYLKYLSKSNVWRQLDSFDGIGTELASVVIPADSLDEGVKLRFYFISDGGYSDEDGLFQTNGAVVIDSLTVADTTGVLDFQDFETESPGALTTADGDWTAGTYQPFGDYAALFDGSTLLQEDTLVTNTTYVWGFFNGSTATYECGGHPEQAAVPFSLNPGSDLNVNYINNEIWSPFIELTRDENGTPITSELGGLILEYDVYRDLPLENLVFYTDRVRYLYDGEPTAWSTPAEFKHSLTGGIDWYREIYDYTSSYVQGATHIQIAIGCADGCIYWCGVFGDGSCHSHAPLIDNVRLIRTSIEPIMVTNTNDSGPGSLRQAILDSNDQGDTDPDRDAIYFDIPGTGPFVITLATNLPASIRPVVIDATTQPGYNGTPLVVIDGGGQPAGRRGPEINGNSSIVRGLEIRNFYYEGLKIGGSDYTIVESNYIHHNGDVGIVVHSSSNCMIGGTSPEPGNTITNNTDAGIAVSGNSTDNSILCNSIYGNTGLGIDLLPLPYSYGVTPNDERDPDTGPNHLQNFPVIRWAYSPTSSIGASLNSASNSTFLIQFFSNSDCNGSGNGGGRTWLGSTEVTTDAGGNVDFGFTTAEPFAEGEYITATATDAAGNSSEFSACLIASTATATNGDMITRPTLYPAVPNPFNPSTSIRYDVPHPGAHVRIAVYDVSGALVALLVDAQQTPGRKRAEWDGLNDRGEAAASGIYFYRMTAGGFSMTRKMVLLK